jgi:tetratricopeptide (TPR) repeat protein
MIILGLAHPALLEHHRIPIVQEARRLAVLLEKKGEVDRAQTLLEVLAQHAPGDRAVERELGGIMRRTGSLDRLVERHLRRAEEAMRAGHRDEAVRWLREVLMLDGSRRDVARMIRDLRYEAGERHGRWRRRLQRIALVVVALGAAYGIVWREMHIEADYAALTAAKDGDVASMQRRLSELDAWIASNPLWLGMFDAGRERGRLRTELEKIEAAERESAQQRVAAHVRAEAVAESERVLGRRAAEQSDFAGAREHFQKALEAAPADWKPRLQVQTDIEAIGAWQQKNQAKSNSQRGAQR